MSNNSSSNSVLMAIILIITFPVWFAVGAAVIGVAVGLAGAAIGIVAAIFGVIVAIITIPFKILFGWGHGHGHWHDWGDWSPSIHLHNHWFLIVSILIIAYLITRNRKTVN